MGAIKEYIMIRCKEWADDINSLYDLKVDEEEVQNEVLRESSQGEEFSFLWELQGGSFTDSAPRERMVDAICMRRIRMKHPTYGHSEGYKQEFEEKMFKWIAQKDLTLD